MKITGHIAQVTECVKACREIDKLGNLVQFHGFNLRLRGDVLQRRFGLLTTRQKTLPRARIQRVTIEQTWLRRLLGYAVVKADSAGGSRSDGQDATGGWDVVVPLARTNDAHALLPAMLPGVERETFSWRRGSPRLIARTAAQGVLLAAAAARAARSRCSARVSARVRSGIRGGLPPAT